MKEVVILWEVHSFCQIILQSLLIAGGFSVFAGVGERTREGNDLYKEMTESVSSIIVELQIGSSAGSQQQYASAGVMIAGCHQAG